MEITPEVRALALEQASRRCECTGSNCRHHLRNHRCKRGLRGDAWKVYWRSEDGGVTRENISAWCLECFANNFEVPRETVALLAPDIADYARLLEDDARRALTVKSVLQDAARDAARRYRGRMVMDRIDDDVLIELPCGRDALEAARGLNTGFHTLAERLDLPSLDLLGAIHVGEVTRWRNGMLVGEALEVATAIRKIAASGTIVVTGPVARELNGSVELEAIDPAAAARAAEQLPDPGEVWALHL